MTFTKLRALFKRSVKPRTNYSLCGIRPTSLGMPRDQEECDGRQHDCQQQGRAAGRVAGPRSALATERQNHRQQQGHGGNLPNGMEEHPAQAREDRALNNGLKQTHGKFPSRRSNSSLISASSEAVMACDSTARITNLRAEPSKTLSMTSRTICFCVCSSGMAGR